MAFHQEIQRTQRIQRDFQFFLMIKFLANSFFLLIFLMIFVVACSSSNNSCAFCGGGGNSNDGQGSTSIASLNFPLQVYSISSSDSFAQVSGYCYIPKEFKSNFIDYEPSSYFSRTKCEEGRFFAMIPRPGELSGGASKEFKFFISTSKDGASYEKKEANKISIRVQ